jgi:hypothetical protein
MRSLLPAFVIALSLGAGACSAPAEDAVGEGSGAASSDVPLDRTISESEAAALRGEGLQACESSIGDATICAYPSGFAVISNQGIAIVRADGDVLTAKALASSDAEARDVAEVVAAADEPAPDVATAAIHPLGKIQLAGTALGFLERALELLASTSRKASVAVSSKGAGAAAKQAEVAAAKDAELAAEARRFARAEEASYEAAAKGPMSFFGGQTMKEAAANTTRWFAATKRVPVALATYGGDSWSAAALMEARYEFVHLQQGLKEGERLTLVLSNNETWSATKEFVDMARSLDMDVVMLGLAPREGGVAAVVRAAEGGLPYVETMKLFTSRVFSLRRDNFTWF